MQVIRLRFAKSTFRDRPVRIVYDVCRFPIIVYDFYRRVFAKPVPTGRAANIQQKVTLVRLRIDTSTVPHVSLPNRTRTSSGGVCRRDLPNRKMGSFGAFQRGGRPCRPRVDFDARSDGFVRRYNPFGFATRSRVCSVKPSIKPLRRSSRPGFSGAGDSVRFEISRRGRLPAQINIGFDSHGRWVR